MENVTFGYESYEPILEDVSLHVKEGEMIGFVGPSGSGKSTMINLIMRLFDVNRGVMKVDDIDVRTLDKAYFHSQIGVVLQETFLFSDTILNNLRFAKTDATLEEIINYYQVESITPSQVELQRGGIIGISKLTACLTHSHSKWFHGPYGFQLTDSAPLPFHPCKGQLGFFWLN